MIKQLDYEEFDHLLTNLQADFTYMNPSMVVNFQPHILYLHSYSF